MTPAILHADGTACDHAGSPRAALDDDGGPLCPAGQSVTHVEFNGKKLTIEEAAAAFDSMAKTIINAIIPFAAALTELGRKLGVNPAIRALAAMAEVVEAEREREAAMESGQR